MAESYSDIIKNYKNMSVEELGSSLLARKDDLQRQAQKSAKKDARIQQALAVMLGTQAVFKNAFGRRQKEIQATQKLDLLNVESDAKTINNISAITRMIPQDFTKAVKADGTAYTLEENVDRFFSDPAKYVPFMEKMDPIVTKQLEFTGDQTTKLSPEYNATLEVMSREVLSNMLKDDNYVKFVSGLESLYNNETRDYNELLRRGLGVTAKELEGLKRKHYANLEETYRDQTGIFNPKAYTGILKEIGLMKEKEGEINLFRNLKETDVKTPTLNEALDVLELKGIIIPALDKAIASAKLSPTHYTTKAMSKQYEPLKEQLLLVTLPSLARDVKRERVFEKYRLNHYIDDGYFNGLKKNIERNDFMQKQLQNDTVAITLRLKEDRGFATELFKQVKPNATPQEIQSFLGDIRNEEFRNKFSMLVALKVGSQDPGMFSAEEYVGTRIAEMGRKSEVNVPSYMKNVIGYDADKARENISILTEPMFTNDKKTGAFIPTDSYNKLSNENKVIVYDKQVKEIQSAPISPQSRQGAMNVLFETVPNPRGVDQEEYLVQLQEKEIAERAELIGEQTRFEEITKGTTEVQARKQLEKEQVRALSSTVANQFRDIREELNSLPRNVTGVESFFTETPSERLSREANWKNVLTVKDILKEKYNITTGSGRSGVNNIYTSNRIKDELGQNPEIYQDIMNILNDLKEGKEIVKENYMAPAITEIESPFGSEIFTPKAVGEDVTVEAIRAVTNPEDKAARSLLLQTALLESKYGNDRNTFKREGSSGIFQIEKDQAFKEVQRRLKDPTIGANLRRYNDQLKEKFGPEFDMTTATYKDLEKPVYAAAFARAYYMTKAASLPSLDDIEGQANYWKTHYNTSKGKGTVTRFIREAMGVDDELMQQLLAD